MITDRISNNTFYNYTDLNRVENKTAEVSKLLARYGYPVTIITKTTWTKANFPSKTEMDRYLGNVKKCVSQFNAVTGIGLPISMMNLNYVGANNIEKVLLGLEELVDRMISYFRMCSTFKCGEERDK